MNQSTSPYQAQIRAQYGSSDPNSVQTNRRQYYSFVQYPTAGQTVFQFFGSSVGASSYQLTNIQQPGRLDYPFIVKAIRTGIFIDNLLIGQWATSVGTDASTLYSDLVNGFAQAGQLKIVVGSRTRLELPSPFLYAPPGTGMARVLTAGLNAATTTPTGVTSAPYASLGRSQKRTYLVSPNFTIDPTQNWAITINYPSGAIPLIATTVVSGNPLYIGVMLDGVEMRPTN